MSVEFDITRLAKQWASGRRNYGILIVQEPLDEDACAAPHSRESKDRRNRLQLVVECERGKR